MTLSHAQRVRSPSATWGRLRCSRSHAPAAPPRPKRKACAMHAEIPLQYRAYDLARLMQLRNRT